MPRNAHANGVLQQLQVADENGVDTATERVEELTAERDTYPCARCDRLHLDRGHALRCCSDTDPHGGEPA